MSSTLGEMDGNVGSFETVNHNTWCTEDIKIPYMDVQSSKSKCSYEQDGSHTTLMKSHGVTSLYSIAQAVTSPPISKAGDIDSTNRWEVCHRIFGQVLKSLKISSPL